MKDTSMKKTDLRLVFRLFCVFFEIGAFTFGGGYAMIPLIRREVSEKRKWIDAKELLDIIAVAESTPGSLSVHAATFVGYRTAGAVGAAAATVGVVLPSFLIMLVVSVLMNGFDSIPAVKYAFFGVRAAVLALILKALISMLREADKSALFIVIAAGSFAAVGLLGLPVLAVLIGSALIGVLVLCRPVRGGRETGRR